MILKRLQVKTPQVGLLTNSYIICDEETKEAMVIDPGGEPERIAEVLDILNADLKYIFVTHLDENAYEPDSTISVSECQSLNLFKNMKFSLNSKRKTPFPH